MTAPRRWLFGDQWGPHFLDDPHQDVLPIEPKAVFARRRFHRQKVHLVLSAMRHLAAELGDRAECVRSIDYRSGPWTLQFRRRESGTAAAIRCARRIRAVVAGRGRDRPAGRRHLDQWQDDCEGLFIGVEVSRQAVDDTGGPALTLLTI